MNRSVAALRISNDAKAMDSRAVRSMISSSLERQIGSDVTANLTVHADPRDVDISEAGGTFLLDALLDVEGDASSCELFVTIKGTFDDGAVAFSAMTPQVHVDDDLPMAA